MRRFLRLICSISFLFFFKQVSYSQVGIGTTSPDPTSILDITSETQGVLAPRMSSVQRNNIGLPGTPADGLLVYDTDENAFYYYDTSTTWVKLGDAATRNNYKLIKDVSDLADELVAGGTTEYLLDENTLYEINGLITLAAPINLNGAYITGEDTNEDFLSYTGGTLFNSDKGGSIRGVTLSAPGGTVFNMSAGGTETLILRDCVIAYSGSVGTISDYKTVFLSIVQYVGNISGITFTDINQVLLNNEGWDGTNGGIYETFVGDFDILTKQGGFSEVTTATAAIDVTGITSISGSAGMRIVDYYGGGNYINGSSPYTGYNFTNDWDINSPGILVETDNNATGDIISAAAYATGISTNFTGTGVSSRTKISGGTTSNNLFRFAASGDNRLVYDGKQTRYFQINTSISFRGYVNNDIFIFYIAKGNFGDATATVDVNTKVYREIGATNDIGALAITGSIQLSEGDFIEVWAERLGGSGNLLITSMNLVAK